MPDILRDRPGLERRLFELARDVIRAELGVRPAVPFDHQGREPFLGSPHMVGHDGDGIVEPHDLAHAVNGLGRRIIHALQTSTEHGRLRQRCDLHPRRTNVDAVDGGSVDLRGRVQALRRGADELEILRALEHHAFGDGHARGVGGERAIRDPSSGRGVKHFAALRAAGRRIDVPAARRRRHQHGSRDRTGLAQGPPRPPYRVRVAGGLHAQQRVGVELFVGRRMFEAHLLQVHFQLFGDQHRDRRIGALAHLHIRHDQDDLPVAADADEGVGREAIGAGRFGFAVGERQAQAQHQAAASGRADLQEPAPGDAVR